MSLSLEAGLEARFATLRECVATQVYQRGLVKVAGKIDMAPSKLTEKLAGIDSSERPRGMTLDELEAYVAAFNDVTPILYLVSKFCQDPKVVQAEALAKVASVLEGLPALFAAAGLNTPKMRARG